MYWYISRNRVIGRICICSGTASGTLQVQVHVQYRLRYRKWYKNSYFLPPVPYPPFTAAGGGCRAGPGAPVPGGEVQGQVQEEPVQEEQVLGGQVQEACRA